MALRGPIQVNGFEVGRWVAQRTVTAVDGVNTYECGVAWTPEEQQRVFGAGQTPHPERVEFTLTHDYRDGAVALAAKVLTRAIELRDGGDHG